MDIRNGYLHIKDGGTVSASPVIGSGANSSGEVVVSGEGAVFDCGYLYICTASTEWYAGSTGMLHVADGGYAAIRFVRMQTNAVIRLEQGDIDFLYGGYNNRSTLHGGRIEGVGTIAHTSASEGWLENLGGVIAPGLPVGTLTVVNMNHLVNGAGGTIAFQLAGDEVDTYGCLALNNSTLELEGGTLRIALADGYRPERRTTYQLFDVSANGNITGSFDTVEVPHYGEWLLDDLYVNGTVTVLSSAATQVILR